jgi:SAM-dependent methyltransferase
MVWSPNGPVGHESAKVRFEVVPYMRGLVLDLGCGDSKVWAKAVGVDNLKDTALFGTQIKPDLTVPTCERLPFADASVDTVYSSHLLEHIVDYKAALAEWWRVVKPGGYLVLYLPHRDHYPRIGQPGANPDHKHDFAPEDIVEAMREVLEAGNGWDLLRNETRAAEYEYSFLQVYRKRADLEINERPPVLPEKNLGIVRTGGYGDALWVSGLLPQLKAEGWHITVYTGEGGEEVLRHDPHIDAFEVQPDGIFDGGPFQIAYWLCVERRHQRFLNCIGAVERNTLPSPQEPDFYLPLAQRQRLHTRNYVQAVAEWVGLPFDSETVQQKFYPTAAEIAQAARRRAEFDGPVVVINPTGSTLPKWWPHTERLMERLAGQGVHCVVLGDLRGQKLVAPRGSRIVGRDWPIREAIAFAQLAEVVVGEESALVNAVAYEPMLKIVLLSHSSHDNLTRDWTETLAISPTGVDCHPCHRVHHTWTHCKRDKATGAAWCQAAIGVDDVAGQVTQYLAWRAEQEKAAA